MAPRAWEFATSIEESVPDMSVRSYQRRDREWLAKEILDFHNFYLAYSWYIRYHANHDKGESARKQNLKTTRLPPPAMAQRSLPEEKDTPRQHLGSPWMCSAGLVPPFTDVSE